jgi:hypothetical protein
MTDLVVIVPSRGRPENAQALTQHFANTRVAAHLVFAVDEDDPRHGEYADVKPFSSSIDTGGAPSSMVRALNASATARALSDDPPFAIGFMGDDHCPRTYGWDKAYVDALREMGTGIVYGNDLIQGARLPTQVAMTADIVRALGYMAPPALTHLYVDNFWRDLGTVAGCLRYLPDVTVEHRHPIAGKAEWDEGYRRVNDAAMYERDRLAYVEYQRTQFAADVAKVKALRDG